MIKHTIPFAVAALLSLSCALARADDAPTPPPVQPELQKLDPSLAIPPDIVDYSRSETGAELDAAPRSRRARQD